MVLVIGLWRQAIKAIEFLIHLVQSLSVLCTRLTQSPLYHPSVGLDKVSSHGIKLISCPAVSRSNSSSLGDLLSAGSFVMHFLEQVMSSWVKSLYRISSILIEEGHYGTSRLPSVWMHVLKLDLEWSEIENKHEDEKTSCQALSVDKPEPTTHCKMCITIGKNLSRYLFPNNYFLPCIFPSSFCPSANLIQVSLKYLIHKEFYISSHDHCREKKALAYHFLLARNWGEILNPCEILQQIPRL